MELNKGRERSMEETVKHLNRSLTHRQIVVLQLIVTAFEGARVSLSLCVLCTVDRLDSSVEKNGNPQGTKH